MDFLAALNPQQRKAVLHTEGPLLILAGAGSGKTRVVISRIAHLIQNCGVASSALLAVTFTNKAAEEMRNRVASLLSQASSTTGPLPTVSTFHSFCVQLLRSHGDPLSEIRSGFSREFNIYDDADQLAVVKSAFKKLGLDETFMKYRAALSAISHAKNRGESAEQIYPSVTGPQSEKLAVVFENYQDILLKANALDFDDLLLEGVRLLRHSKAVHKSINQRFNYLMVDEYQDTNRPQYHLVRLLGDHGNVCVVGDEDQSIYSWRGASIKNILDFEKDFPGAQVIRLEQNYRSTKKILSAATSVVNHNLERKGKTLWTAGEDGDPVVLYRAPDGESEALYVADEIHRYLNEATNSSAAVLYRTNFQSRQMEEALRRYDRKYVVVGGVSFYRRAEVKDLIAYLKVTATPRDNVSLARIINTPARGIGRTTMDQLEAYARREDLTLWESINRMRDDDGLSKRSHNALTEFKTLIDLAREELQRLTVQQRVAWLYEKTGYRTMLENQPTVDTQARIDNISELLNAATEASQRGEDVHAFLDHAALISDTDDIDNKATTFLMTLHSAKGLEFPFVAMIGMEEGLFPHSRSIENGSEIEEERRLCYVGMTRARNRLLLTNARHRRRYGAGTLQAMTPSRFLSEIPHEVIEDRSPSSAYSWDNEYDPLDLSAELDQVKQEVGDRIADTKTYNSVEDIADFFSKRGVSFTPRGKMGEHSPKTRRGFPGSEPVKPPGNNLHTGVMNGPHRAAVNRNPYQLGTQVRHKKYGIGTILRREIVSGDIKLAVQFSTHGLKKLMAKYANLEPI
jgi:DNA helicase-2/ATP-dependent DNA helicase PcrA